MMHCPECNEPLVNVGKGSRHSVCPNGHGKLYPYIPIAVTGKLQKEAAQKAALAKLPKAERIPNVMATDADWGEYRSRALWTIEGQAGVWRETWACDEAIQALMNGKYIRWFRLWKECPMIICPNIREKEERDKSDAAIES